MKQTCIRIHPKDTVAVALQPLSRGARVRPEDYAPTAPGKASCGFLLREDIPAGHKFALRDIPKGTCVIKYGESIGIAAQDIPQGAHVHTHNLKTALDGVLTYAYHPAHPAVSPTEEAFFQGYRRSDGKAGVRNELWIIPTVGCVNDVAAAIAKRAQDLVSGGIDAVVSFSHPYGCSQTGADHAQTRRLLAALARHPNAGGVLVLSLGCENLTREQFLEELGPFDPDRVKFLTCQQVGDELAAGRSLLRQLAAYAGPFARAPIPAGELVVGMKCGGSDGLSGITANPAIGRFSDMLCARGGSTVLTEVPEMFGGEGFLLGRCANETVFRKAVDMINGFKEYFLSHGEAVYENPSPGNKQGGITTLEDKSCGCVQKGGTAPIADVIGYGEAVRAKGLNLLSGPGNDLVSATALTAAGAHLILFSTGRGTPFGAPAPTLKISTNSALAAKKANWIDFNAGVIADGLKTIDETAQDLYDLVLQVAGGRRTRAEAGNFREIAIFKDGVTL